MTCEVNDIYPQFIELYVYNQNQGCTNVIKKGGRVSVGEKAVPKNRKQERKSVTGQTRPNLISLKVNHYCRVVLTTLIKENAILKC